LETPLENPIDAAWGADGRLYVLPQHEGRVIAVGEIVELCMGSGLVEDGADGEHALETSMGFGAGLAVAGDGRIFVSDQGFARVRRLNPDGTVETVLGTGAPGLGQPGLGPSTAIRDPERLALDEEANVLYVADMGNDRVLSVQLDTLEVSLVASGDLQSPVGLLLTGDGGLLVSELLGDRIRYVAPDGSLTTVAGDPGAQEPRRSAEPLDMQIHGPAGLAWTPEGDLLVAERLGQRVLRWVGARDAL
ncbi:MAG: hypothetical protein KC656_28305, partial [Myxococcales bacterium]|nr:hypothetical protein [Myxococcales bacterium]